MKSIKNALIFLALLLAPVGTASAEPKDVEIVEVQDDQIRSAVSFAFYHALESDAQLDSLERAAETYRRERVRAQTGEHKITLFYSGITAEARNPRLKPILQRWRTRYPKSPTPYVIAAQADLRAITGKTFIEAFSFEAAQSRAQPPEQMEALRKSLEEAREIASTDPHWYVLAGQAALISGADESAFTSLMLEGIGRFPDYEPIYGTATDFFLPKWGRDAGALERWAALAKSHEGSNGPRGVYALIYWHAFLVQYRRDLSSSARIDLEQLREATAVLLAKDPSPRNLTRMALLACVVGDEKQTKQLFDRSKDKLSFYPWAGVSERDVCYAWAHRTMWDRFVETVWPYVWAILKIVRLFA